jgi:hypothetical protein
MSRTHAVRASPFAGIQPCRQPCCGTTACSGGCARWLGQQVAHERGTTDVLMGTPKPRSALRGLKGPALPYRLMALLPGIDLRIVADRTQRTKEEP